MSKFLTKVKENIILYYKVYDEFTVRLDEHHIFLIAAGVAFNILLYLIPMLLVSLWVINRIFGIEMIASFLTNIAQEILPPTEFSNDLLTSTLREVNMIFGGSSAAGIIGVFSLIWLSSTLFASIRTGLNRIFDIATPKIFFIYRIKDIFLTFIFAILILIVSYALPILTLFVSALQENLRPPFSSYISKFSITLFFLFVSLILVYGMFRFMPNKKQPNFIINLSTVISLILIELSRNLFGWYIGKFGTYGKFYGTYAVIVSVSFWIYYMFLIILLTGEAVRFIYEKKILPKKVKPHTSLLKYHKIKKK